MRKKHCSNISFIFLKITFIFTKKIAVDYVEKTTDFF